MGGCGFGNGGFVLLVVLFVLLVIIGSSFARSGGGDG